MDITEQIIGGLCLELQERFPELEIELGTLAGEPIIYINTIYCVVEDGMIKVILPSAETLRTYSPSQLAADCRVVFEYSIVEPDADFEPLFEFLAP